MAQIPSIGRIVHLSNESAPAQCYAAIVAYVWSDTVVNLLYISYDGSPFSKTSVSFGDLSGQWHWPEFVPPPSNGQSIVTETIGPLI